MSGIVIKHLKENQKDGNEINIVRIELNDDDIRLGHKILNDIHKLMIVYMSNINNNDDHYKDCEKV